MPRGKHTMPRTIRRSPKHAQHIYEETLENAEKTYGEGRRAHQTAYAALKHEYQRVGDRWQPKKKGPSDPRAKRGAHQRGGRTLGGVDEQGSTRRELYARAAELGIRGRSRMNKQELADAVARKQRRAA